MTDCHYHTITGWAGGHSSRQGNEKAKCDGQAPDGKTNTWWRREAAGEKKLKLWKAEAAECIKN